ncbi:hypothetical protein CFC21_066202 [Triticum aestivum]|uniref:Cyclin N-terminal domain-containing protein n=2 Tax=Triticum aestivum TaxID=4565 RepID=A0A9R1KM89_WHEAT|nr:cyclin-D4-1-like [Triticum aestivum]KAF7059274.1 hypothetical protein CFC21_066202 [Triticum aestivum]
MAPSYEMAASILLCAEDSSSIFGFGDEQEAAAGARASRSPYCGGELAVEFPLPSEECVARWVATEAEHMPREDYAERLRAGGVDLRVRVDAVDWIWKVHTYYGFGSITACLALNYMDRFLSLYQIPEGKAWMTQLLSVACLSLAAKMDETSVPQSIDLQVAGDARYVFEAKTIQRMELLVLSTLKWRMQAVTPFSYLDYFLHQLCGGNAPSRQAVRDATELILCISRGTSCLEFRPSEIAATVAAAVAGEEHAVHKAACCTHVDKERVLSCHEAMIQATGATVPPPKTAGLRSAYSPAMSAPRSPTGVLDLDAGYLSCTSDGASTTTITMASSPPPASSGFDSSPVSRKRRKISR